MQKIKGSMAYKKMYTKILRVRYYVPNARYTWIFENVASAARYLELNDMARKFSGKFVRYRHVQIPYRS
jgi:hypothetical protein